jgi:hypothetical protein
MALTFRIVCPYCGQPTRAPAEAFYRWWPDEKVEEALRGDSEAEAAAGSYCPECDGLISLVVKGRDDILRPILSDEVEESDWGHYQADLKLADYFPKPAALGLGRTVPAEIRKVFPDLIEDVNRRRNAVGSLTLCRSILEVALRELEKAHGLSANSRSNIVSRVDRLKEAGVITSALAEWAHEIRLDGNQSAHELRGELALARAYSDFLVQFLDVAFELPRRIQVLKAGKAIRAASRRSAGRKDA